MKNHSFCTKENIQVKYFGICTALLSEEKTFPSVENVLRRRALGRIKHLEQGVFYGVWGGGAEGASVRTCQSEKNTKGHNATGKLDLTALAR